MGTGSDPCTMMLTGAFMSIATVHAVEASTGAKLWAVKVRRMLDRATCGASLAETLMCRPTSIHSLQPTCDVLTLEASSVGCTLYASDSNLCVFLLNHCDPSFLCLSSGPLA